MLQNDEAGIQGGNVAHNVFPVLDDLEGSRTPTFDVKVSSIKCGLRVEASPHNRRKTHCNGDGPNSLINVTIRRPHEVRGNTQHIFNNFFGPTKFSDNLFVGQSSQVGVTPCVDANLMSANIFHLQSFRKFESSRTYYKECRLQVV